MTIENWFVTNAILLVGINHVSVIIVALHDGYLIRITLSKGTD